jgi:MFS family permease
MLAPYRALLGLPGARRLVLSSIVGRIPYGMVNLALVLFVRDVTGSYAAAGLTSAVNAGAVCLGGPAQGRVIDRVGQLPVLLVCGVLHAASLVAAVAFGLGGAPLWTVVTAAAAAGAFVPPLSPALRTLWPLLVERGQADRRVLDTAYAFEAVSIEVLFVVGPLLAAVLIAVASPAACVLVGGALALAGSVAFATAEASRTWKAGGRAGAHWLGPLRAPAVLMLLAVAVPHGTAVGLIEIGLPTYADLEGARPAAGVLIACWAVGSLLGGVFYGSRERLPGTPASRLVVLHAALAVTAVPLISAAGIWPMAAFCLLAGVPLAPAAACLYALLAEHAPEGGETEANTWLISGIVGGIGLGGGLAGVLVEGPGPEAAFAAGAVLFLATAAVAAAGRGRLAASPGTRPVRSAA